MRLLFDQNISFRIVKKVNLIFPGSQQVNELGLENKSDLEIWQFARDKGYTIVTFDADFYDLGLVKGVPPKIIWLRTGNTHTSNIATILESNAEIIIDFISEKEYEELGCLELK
jgi:predicted nuclease of predicted toxin-antitoxin system